MSLTRVLTTQFIPSSTTASFSGTLANLTKDVAPESGFVLSRGGINSWFSNSKRTHGPLGSSFSSGGSSTDFQPSPTSWTPMGRRRSTSTRDSSSSRMGGLAALTSRINSTGTAWFSWGSSDVSKRTRNGTSTSSASIGGAFFWLGSPVTWETGFSSAEDRIARKAGIHTSTSTRLNRTIRFIFPPCTDLGKAKTKAKTELGKANPFVLQNVETAGRRRVAPEKPPDGTARRRQGISYAEIPRRFCRSN